MANKLVQLPNHVIKETLNKIAQEHLKTSNFKLTVEEGSSKGDNYIGIIYRVQLKAENDSHNKNNNSDNSLSIIIKASPENEARRKEFCIVDTFSREITVYEEMIPMLSDFQKRKGLKSIADGGFYETPYCYATIKDFKCEAIFLDDLKPKGFTMFNRLNDIDYNHVRLVMKALGKLHALSFAMKDQIPEKLAKYKQFKEMFEVNEGSSLQLLEGPKEKAFDVLKSNQNLIDKVNEYFGNKSMLKLIIEKLQGASAEPYAVLCHGDCWTNNVLFKYKDNKPIEVCLLDWQLTRYASPVCDLVYFIFGCTTKELRDKHYNDFLNIYHNELSTLLKKLGSDPEKLFPRNALSEQLQKFGSVGFLFSLIVLPFITAHAEDIPDLNDVAQKINDGVLDHKEEFKFEHSQSEYANRIRDVVIDMIELGYM